MNDLKEYISFKKLYIHSIWRKVSSCMMVVNISIGVYYHVMPNRVLETNKLFESCPFSTFFISAYTIYYTN